MDTNIQHNSFITGSASVDISINGANTGLDIVANDIIADILLYLDGHHLLNTIAVCKRFRKIAVSKGMISHMIMQFYDEHGGAVHVPVTTIHGRRHGPTPWYQILLLRYERDFYNAGNRVAHQTAVEYGGIKYPTSHTDYLRTSDGEDRFTTYSLEDGIITMIQTSALSGLNRCAYQQYRNVTSWAGSCKYELMWSSRGNLFVLHREERQVVIVYYKGEPVCGTGSLYTDVPELTDETIINILYTYRIFNDFRLAEHKDMLLDYLDDAVRTVVLY